MSHEESITIQNRAGKWVNIPSVVNGKKLSDRDATKAYETGVTGPLGGLHYDSVDDAVKAAVSRSKRMDRRVKGR